MSHEKELKRLKEEIASHMTHLSKGMVYGLSLYVLGMVIMQHCGQTRVAALMSGLRGEKFNTVRQRLREVTYEAKQKRGEKRKAIDVRECFAPLMSWVLSKFGEENDQIVLAMDATYLKDRFTILCVSVVVAGCGIPVAWHIQRSHTKGGWNPIWKRLFDTILPVMPLDWTVIILSDAALYSRPLYEQLTDSYPHQVFMRTSSSHALFRKEGSACWLPIQAYLVQGMRPRILRGDCFKTNTITCTLVLLWDRDADKPCILITNLPTPSLPFNFYTLRYWIESGFKDIKRGFFHWEHTKMADPKRAERLWLVITIGLLWMTSVGEASTELDMWQDLQETPTQYRRLSAPLLGWIQWMISLLNSTNPPASAFQPYYPFSWHHT